VDRIAGLLITQESCINFVAEIHVFPHQDCIAKLVITVW
jgi:hypothetical protein